MTMLRRRTFVGLAAAALLLAPALTACSQAAEKAAEIAAEQALEGAGQDVDITDDSVTVTDEEGNEATVGDDVPVPDSWPSAVPLFDGGKVQMVSVTADGSAVIVWQVDGTPEDVAAAYAAQLESAGYTEDTVANVGGMVVNQYKGNGYTVALQALEMDGATGLSVQATPDS